MEQDLRISMSKTLAGGSKYFSLFEKHIPALKPGANVYLYMLGNASCISQIIQKNPEATYFIYDSDYVFDAIKLLVDEIDVYKCQDVYNIDMKFDCIIMNPPYQKNLHLKILAEAIKHLKDDNSKCVNLSPDNWLTNPYKMFEHEKMKRDAIELIGSHITDYQTIDADDFNDTFSTSNWFGVGIFTISKNKTNFNVHQYDSHNSMMIKIIGKIVELDSLRSHFSRRTNAKFFVPVRRTNHGYLDWCEFDDSKIKSKDGIQFNSQVEVDNFKQSIIDTFFYKFLGKCEWTDGQNSAAVPWMGDSINPRTGLKGYLSEWTDSDFYKFFSISDDERKVIEDTMVKYSK